MQNHNDISHLAEFHRVYMTGRSFRLTIPKRKAEFLDFRSCPDSMMAVASTSTVYLWPGIDLEYAKTIQHTDGRRLHFQRVHIGRAGVSYYVTIPSNIRQVLGWKPGDCIAFTLWNGQALRLEKIDPASLEPVRQLPLLTRRNSDDDRSRMHL